MRTLTLLSTLVLTLALGATALAGGWAVTTLDQLPPDFRAQETYSIGYTIRQHGETPVNVDKAPFNSTTEIRITSPDGAKTLSYKGVQTGATGHYVAQVIFPYDGAWTWKVTQGPFEAQSLGQVKVLPFAGAAQQAAPAGAAAPAPVSPSGPNPMLITALLLATAGAAILFGTRLAAFGRRAKATA